MEEPGYNEVSARMVGAGYHVKTIPVVPFPTWDAAYPHLEGASLVFATPASQFPSNTVMPLEIRRELVAWANENDAYVIDDEYCWEFQRTGTRPPVLAALDAGERIISMGTFSNSFSPAVCLSFAVLPPALMLRWQEAERDAHPQVPWQTQAAMAAFMRNDLWRSHIRRSRATMQQKRTALENAVQQYLGDAVDVIQGESSLFLLVRIRDGRSEQELIEAAKALGIRVYPTRQYWHNDPPEDWNYVQIGFAGIPADKIEPGIALLAKAWGV